MALYEYALTREVPRRIYCGVLVERRREGRLTLIRHSDGAMVEVPSELISAVGYTHEHATPSPTVEHLGAISRPNRTWTDEAYQHAWRAARRVKDGNPDTQDGARILAFIESINE